LSKKSTADSKKQVKNKGFKTKSKQKNFDSSNYGAIVNNPLFLPNLACNHIVADKTGCMTKNKMIFRSLGLYSYDNNGEKGKVLIVGRIPQ